MNQEQQNINSNEFDFGDTESDFGESEDNCDRSGENDFEDGFHNAPTVEYEAEELSGGNPFFCILGFLAPGAGLCVTGHPHLGIAVNIALAWGFILMPLAAVKAGMFPVPFFVILFLLLLSAWGAGISRSLMAEHTDMSLPWMHVGIAVLTFWLPFGICLYIGTNAVVQRTWMGDNTMNPGIHAGDIVLVDKTAYWHEEPVYGDLVLVEDVIREDSFERRRAFFGRIIARPGDKVQLFGLHPSVNGKRLMQYNEKNQDVIFNSKAVSYEIPYDVEAAELPAEPEYWYPIRVSRQLLFSKTNLVTLEPDFYYVLEDNRDMSERARKSYGSIVHKTEIKGRPQYIIYNTEEESHFSRYGKELR